MRTEKQCGAVAELFPVLRSLVNAFSATGAHSDHVKRASAVLTACEAHHKSFTQDQINSVAALALTLGTLKDELAGTPTGIATMITGAAALKTSLGYRSGASCFAMFFWCGLLGSANHRLPAIIIISMSMHTPRPLHRHLSMRTLF